MLLPGVVESINVIIDNQGIDIFNLPKTKIRPLFTKIRQCFKQFVKNIFILNCSNSLVRLSWGVIKLLLDKTTIEKVKFSDTNSHKDLLEIHEAN